MRKPVIAISANTFADPHYEFPGHRRVVVNEDYSRSVAAAGGVPVLLPPGEDLGVCADQLALADALLLTGGFDVAPLRYGEQPRQLCQSANVLRDAYEWELLRIADERDLPTFGICRGMQILNVYYGGTLYQDLSEAGTSLRHNQLGEAAAPAHAVTLTGFAADVIGRSETLVNSFHHQVVKELAPGFVVAATAPDGMIEAIERPGGRLVAGVQWHPEMASATNPDAQALFRWLIARVG